MQCALGVSTHMGWAAVAALLTDAGKPCAVRTFRLQTGDPAEPDSIEPYHAAGGYRGAVRVRPPPDPDRVVARGLQKQRRHTAKHLTRLLRALNDWPPPAHAGLFVGRGRQAESLERVLASHAQIHVAEGNAVRDSIRRALAGRDIALLEIDRRDLFEQTRNVLHLDPDAATAALRALRPDNGGVWRQEERHCALCAWLAITAALTAARDRAASTRPV